MRSRKDDEFPDNGFEAWGGYMQAKIAKLEEQFESRTDEKKESNLFQGISIFVNGYTKPSADELKLIMLKHSGVYHTYQRSNDYVIASNLPDTKVKRLNTKKIVRPEWITDSLAANCILDYKQYLLYSKHTRTQPRLQFDTFKSSTPPQSKSNQEHVIENINVEKSKSGKNTVESTSTSCGGHSEDFHADKTSNVEIHIEADSASLQAYNPSKGSVTSYKENMNKEAVRTAVDPNFLSEFYSNSRLHHISQLGATFKQYVNELREATDFVFPARVKLKQAIESLGNQGDANITASNFKNGKIIMHIDMDCFFVSVGLRQRPELRGEPVAVTHARGGRADASSTARGQQNLEFDLYRRRKAKALSKAIGIPEEQIVEEHLMKSRLDDLDGEEDFGSLSEIASCSYEARAMGIRNGMFMGAARRLCPDLKTIPYDFEGYKEVAYTLYDTIAQYTLDIEAVSCDELYADLSPLVHWLDLSAARVVRALRAELRAATGCPCSAGVGSNRIQARLATKKAKPDGQFFMTSDLVDEFMMDVKVADLPGVGRQLLERVSRLCGADDVPCAALRALPAAELTRHLGAAAGRLLRAYSRGEDQRPLAFVTVRKSVSAEVNYGIRLENDEQLERFLRQLCEEVHRRLQSSRMLTKCITLKVMVRAPDAPVQTAKFMGHGFCDTQSKSVTLLAPTDCLDVITKEVLQICAKLKVDPIEMRGLGIQLTKLDKCHKSNVKTLKAFLTRPSKKNTEVGNATQSANVENMIKNENSSDRVDNVLTSWISRTPTKILNGNDSHSRTPTKELAVLKVTPAKSPAPKISTTPLKRSPASTPPKSPAKKRTLGLTRRRGRPARSAAPAASKLVMHKFLSGQRAHTATETLDPDILAELPEDIRREVLEYYQPSVAPPPLPTPRPPPPAPRPEQPQHLEHPAHASSAIEPRTTEHAALRGAQLSGLPAQQTREMLRSWFAGPPPRCPPPPCHVELVSSHMQQLVVDRRIDRLFVLVKFFKRNIEETQDASWLPVYNHVVEGIQQTMVAVYGKPLLLE